MTTLKSKSAISTSNGRASSRIQNAGEARDNALKDALSTYAGQEKGSITVTFCPEAMFEEMAKAMKATGHITQKAVMADFGNAIVYSLHMDKKDDSITVVASTFADIGKF